MRSRHVSRLLTAALGLARARRRLRRRRRGRCVADRPRRATPRPPTSAPRRRAARRSPSATPPGPGGSRWPSPRRRGSSRSVGLDVDLRFFADYLGSLDALAAGAARRQHPDAQRHHVRGRLGQPADDRGRQRQLDRQRRHHLRRVDRRRSPDLEGKTIAAEPGVVDHFLLLQGLDTVGMTEDDIDFRGVLTADAAAGFAGGEFDCVGRVRPLHPAGARAGGQPRRSSTAPTSRARSPTTSSCRPT